MTHGKTLIIVLVTLIIGFGAGFVLRPVIVPVERTAIVAGPPAAAPAPAEPRGAQYFAAHLDEARQVVAQLICPLLSGPISILELATKEEWNGEEAQAGRDHRQVA